MTTAEIALRVLSLHLGEELLLGFGDRHVLVCRPLRPDAVEPNRFWVEAARGIVNIRLVRVRGIYLCESARPN